MKKSGWVGLLSAEDEEGDRTETDHAGPEDDAGRSLVDFGGVHRGADLSGRQDRPRAGKPYW